MRSALNIHVIRTEAWLYRALFCFCFLFAFSYLRIHHFTNGCTVPLEKTRFSIWRNLKGGKCSCCVYLLSMETSHCDSVMVKVANCPRHIRSLFWLWNSYFSLLFNSFSSFKPQNNQRLWSSKTFTNTEFYVYPKWSNPNFQNFSVQCSSEKNSHFKCIDIIRFL